MNNDGIVVRKFSFKSEFTRYFLAVALVIFIVFFWLMNHRFLSYLNTMNILRDTAIMATLSMAAMFVLMVGELNFGLGAEATLAASLLGFLWASGWIPNYFLCMAVVLIVMLLVAWLNSRLTFIWGSPLSLLRWQPPSCGILPPIISRAARLSTPTNGAISLPLSARDIPVPFPTC